MPGTATTILIDGTPTDYADPWIDSLVGGGAWKDSDGGTVTIQWTAFQGTMDGQNSYGWTPVALAGLREALSLWESVANIDFVEVSGAANADVKFWWGTEAQAGGAGVLGWSDLPGFPDYYENPGSETRDVLFNAEDPAMYGALDDGGLGLVTMVHEIGHLLGLAHPHDGGAAWDAATFPGVNWWDPYNIGTGGLNQGIYTTMSYNYGWETSYSGHTAESFGLQYGPMALDIAAIQAIYGANTNYASGNNVYMLPTASQAGTYWSSIWDTGGIDTISNAGSSNDSTIDLREAAAGINGGGYISHARDEYGKAIEGGYTIARGVVIENAIGGSGNDNIAGNAAVNRLDGGAGNDILDGGAGADTMVGGVGYDSYYVDDYGDVILDDAGIDTVYSSLAIYALAPNLENLTLTGTGPNNGTGNSLANVLTGNAGANILTGGGGADILDGLDGNDRLIVSDLSFLRADGGTGTDTLVLNGAGLSIRLATTTIIQGIERFDLTGTGNNTLWIDQQSVLARFGEEIAGKRVLVVERDQGDVVQFADSGWTNAGTFNNAIGTFDRWVFGNAEVHVRHVEAVPLPPGTVLLSSLNGSTGFKVSGVTEGDYSGWSVASAGDVNGDGFDDVIIGAQMAGTDTTEPGASYVVFGKASGFSSSIDLSTLNGSNGFKLNGVDAHDYSGRSVASAGDVNGDGFADIVIGARGDDWQAGVTYVVFGKASGFPAEMSLSVLNGSDGFKVNGADAFDTSGWRVASAGDFNGDGYDDLMIGAITASSYRGAAYIVYGKATGFEASLGLSGLTAAKGVRLIGAQTGSWAGYSLASAGDVNGDGFDDVIVSAMLAGQTVYGAHPGVSYVVFGMASAGANINLSSLNGSNGFKLSGAAGEFSGRSVASAGDVNGDGYADLIVGAANASPNGAFSGASYVVFGKASGFAANLNLSTLNGSNGFRLSGVAAGDLAGFSVASAGDFNGDGFADLIVGAHGVSAEETGASYIVFGKASGFGANIDLSSLDGSNGLALWGEAAYGLSGWSVSSAGDVNGDDYDDLIIGARGDAANGTNSGASYVVFGGAFGSSSAPAMTIGTVGTEVLIGGRGDDVLRGGGGGDVFHAGAGNDRVAVKDLGFRLADGGNGIDTLGLDGAGLSLDLSNALVAAKLLGIERIDLTGTGNNALIVSKLSVLGGVGKVVDGKHILVVEGNSGDKVQFAEANWSKTGTFSNADGTFDRWVLGNAEVHVKQFELVPTAGATIVGTAGNDIISTTVTVPGQSLATSLSDVIDGAAGADTMSGGQGDDTYLVDNAGDQTIEVAGGGVDLVLSSITWTLGDHVENLTLAGPASINGTGNSSSNIITGNAGNNVLDGGVGDDVMAGGLGDDTYGVDSASDVVTELAGEGTDTVNAWIGWTLGANVEQLRLIGVADLNGFGNGLNNVLFGNAGKNFLNGGAGSDTMNGGLGDDTYIVDQSDDVLVESAGGGTDLVQSSAASYQLGANVENLILTGMGNTNGVGNEVANVLTGNAGNNVLDGGTGADKMSGWAGDDTYVVDNAGDVVTEGAGEGTDTINAWLGWTLGTSLEQLRLMGTADLNGTGNSLDNALFGNAGNNVLDGGVGADTMAGGLGNDTYVVDNAGDLVTELAGGGTDTVQASLNWVLGAALEKLTFTGDGNLNGTGNDLANTLTGNAGNNRLDGGAGADTMAGGQGDDTYVVDVAGDVVTEAADQGTDTVEAWLGWTLGANLEQLRLKGAADLAGTGNGLNNVLWGNAGKNVLDGKVGADTMSGGLGDDTYLVDNAGDVVTENAGEGTDTVEARVDWTLGANLEQLRLMGSGHLAGTGNGLNNVLFGNAGKNVLDGGAGADTMAGGDGNDTYIVDNALDVVTELDGGGVDTVLSSINWSLGAALENLTLTGTAVRSGTGNELANTLTGNTGNNLLDGKADADTMAGGLGDDTYVVDEAGDVVVEEAGAGIDTVQSSVTWRLRVNVEKLVLTGNANVNGTGNELDNTLTGNVGNNVLDGGAGADTMTGGLGDDTYVVDNADDRANENAGGGTDTVQSSVSHSLRANIENLVLTGSAAINGNGNGEANILTGNGAANILDGRAGADRMEGRGGKDVYLVDDAGDVVIEGVGGGVDEVRSSVSYTLAAYTETLRLLGTGDLDGTGNDVANVLIGNSGDSRLDGGAGADTMVGGLGDDTYVIDNAGDRANELSDGGIDTVLSSISLTLRANLENLVLTGTAAINGVGNGDANILTGNDANNILDGAGGADTMIGGGGDDTYFVEMAGDVVVELAAGGTDSVRAWISHTLTANVEKLRLYGVADIDATGNKLANVVTGNGGHNVLDGGLGADTLNGGGGGDAFRFSTALGPDNVDRIVAFNHASDTIQLDHAIFASLGLGALDAGAFNLGEAATQADDRILFHAASKSLYYDADGLGGAAAIRFATFDTLTGTLDHSDFLIV